MSKRIETPAPTETVTIAQSSLENIFSVMEDMSREIAELRAMVASIPKPEDEIFNVNDAANYCGVTRQTIARWTRQKMLHKVFKRGKQGYLKSELDRARTIN